MKIIPLVEGHLDEVVEMEDRDGDVHWTREHFEKELSGEVVRFFVVVEQDKPGVMAYGGYWKAGPEAQITNLVVRKEYRCQGIGSRLLLFLMDCARSEMCTLCTLEVRQRNTHAQALYQSLGFEVRGTRPRLYSNPVEDAALMEKQL